MEEIKKVFLVDYENVKTQGLDGLLKLHSTDEVHIFYSEKADSMTFGLHRRLNETQANIFYQKVEVGTKNALDFQLSSYLGYLIKENTKESKYCIVTKDKGFECLVSYWKKRRVNIMLCENLIEKVAEVESDKEKKDELTLQVEEYIQNDEDIEFVVKTIKQYKTKQGINNALLKHYKDGKKSSEIYTAIKPLIKDKKGK